jgi:hypothetical protein
MKLQTMAAHQTPKIDLPPVTIRTGTEACAGPREGVVVTFVKQATEPSKGHPKPF